MPKKYNPVYIVTSISLTKWGNISWPDSMFQIKQVHYIYKESSIVNLKKKSLEVYKFNSTPLPIYV